MAFCDEVFTLELSIHGQRLEVTARRTMERAAAETCVSPKPVDR